MKVKYLILSFILISSFALSAVGFAEKVTVVEGLIEDVSGNSVKVNGSYYNISGASLLEPSGRQASTSNLKEGKKIKIYFKNGNISSVLITEDMPE